MPLPNILVTNDDGIHEPGLLHLVDALSGLGKVHVYAPQTQQSAVGHGMSLHRPLRVTPLREGWHMVDGTPTDCVMLAARNLLGFKPDLVVSGINPGANLGDDVTYSGTVAGAYEGMLQGLPSFAVSSVAYVPQHFAGAAAVAREIAAWILENGLPKDTTLNVNVPDLPLSELKGMHITRMGRRHYEDEIVKRTDPRGGMYYWIGGATPGHHPEPDSGTDFEAVEAGYVSVTPLLRDLTRYDLLAELGELGLVKTFGKNEA